MTEKNLLTLSDEFIRFCELNGYDVQQYAQKIFEKAFNEAKYSTSPYGFGVVKVHKPTEEEIKESNELVEESPQEEDTNDAEKPPESTQNKPFKLNVRNGNININTDIYGDD